MCTLARLHRIRSLYDLYQQQMDTDTVLAV